MGCALLLVDIQNDYFAGGKSELANPLDALGNAKKVLEQFRKKGMPIVHVRHVNMRSTATFFLPDTIGAEIHEDVAPLAGESVVVKHAPNSFLGTNLKDILQEKSINKLVVCGMMTHMCIDTTVRACMDMGIEVILIDDACTTKDLVFEGEVLPAKTVHNVFMAALGGHFAQLVKARDFKV